MKHVKGLNDGGRQRAAITLLKKFASLLWLWRITVKSVTFYRCEINQLLPNRRSVAAVLLLAATACVSAWAQGAGAGCGSLENGYGPYDYRTDHTKLPIVTGAHFTAPVEALIRGSTATLPGPDISYTLRAIPNHHRALISMMKLGEKEKTSKPSGSAYTVACWFTRAIAFRPDDAIVRMIYSGFLNSKGNINDANNQLESATASARDNGFTHYNIGLHYFDLKNYDKALVQAHKAIGLGFNHADLRNQLTTAGKWREPEATPASTDPAAAGNPGEAPAAAATAPASAPAGAPASSLK